MTSNRISMRVAVVLQDVYGVVTGSSVEYTKILEGAGKRSFKTHWTGN